MPKGRLGIICAFAASAVLAAVMLWRPVLAAPAQSRWTSIGPMPIYECPNSPDSGRVSSIAADPSDLNHWLLGTGNGGVWETRNAGTSWVPLTDGEATLAIGAVAFAPSNPSVIYAATGEAVSVAFAKAGLGVLKTTDGGQHWNLLAAASFARAAVRRVRVHPTNPDFVVATAARGGFGRDSLDYAPSPPPFGVLRSTDGGVTWNRTLAGIATALEIDSTNFNNQYAAIGDVNVPNVLNDSPGALPNGLYRSTDGGQTWAAIAGPWGVATTSSAPMRRIELAIGTSNPNVLYASLAAPDGSLLGLWRTDNAWASVPTWIQVPTGPTGPGGYCGPTFKCNYSHVITVDPADANRFFGGGSQQGFWRCTNCGASPTWTDVNAGTCVHPDHHALAWAGTRLIDGNDGGIWSTANLGASWANHNTALPTNMFFNAALHPTDPNFILGGLRDFAPAIRVGGGTTWQALGNPAPGGEWGEAEVAMSSTRPDTDWMVTWLFGNIWRTTDGGRTGVQVDGGIDKSGQLFVTPVRKCPSNENVFLAGTRSLWRTNNFFSATPPTWVSNGRPAVAAILSIAYAPSDTTCSTYAYGDRSGLLFLTQNAGATWTDLNAGSQLPLRPVNGLAFDPGNPNILYVGLSSFDVATPGKPGHVFKTTNALAGSPTWSNISPPIDVPFNVMAIDPRNPQLVYAGSDTGLWHSVDAGASWLRDGVTTGLPNAPIYDIQINPATDRTVVFTYGRGAYALTTLGRPNDDLVIDFGATFGVWLRDGGTGAWTQFHTASAKNIVTGDLDGNGIDEVIVDFGPSFGLWVWVNNSTWIRLHTSTATRMVTGDLDGNGRAELLVDFAGFGIWVWANNTSWFQLNLANSNNIVTGDLDGNSKQEAIIDFPGFGIWVWKDNTSWFQLHSLNSRLMTVGDFDGNGQADLLVDFAGHGLWSYGNNGTWSQVHQFSASHLAAGDVDGNGQSDVIVDFGNPYGIWLLQNGATWTQLHTLTSTNILTGDSDSNGKADVIINFGAAGLWEYVNNTSWVRLHTVSPGAIAVGHISPL